MRMGPGPAPVLKEVPFKLLMLHHEDSNPYDPVHEGQKRQRKTGLYQDTKHTFTPGPHQVDELVPFKCAKLYLATLAMVSKF